MKKFIYISGIAGLNVFTLGALLKIMHWPGANIFIFTGLCYLAVVFLPLAFSISYKDSQEPSLRWVYITGFLCAFIDITGALFKILHFPGANWFLLIGTVIPFILFLPVFMFYHVRSGNRQMKGLLSVMFLMTYIAVFSVMLAVRA